MSIMRASSQRREVEIVLRDGENSLYTTNDSILGYLSLCFDEDVLLKKLTLTLEGEAVTCVNNVSSLLYHGGNVFGKHKFLRMSQSIQPTSLPEDDVALKGQCYKIPFNFTVPGTLLPYACSHGRSTPESHLSLPPSLGAYETKNVIIQDMGPNTAKVNYRIFARITKAVPRGVATHLEKSACIHIIPTTNLEIGTSIYPTRSRNDCSEVRESLKVPRNSRHMGGQLVVSSRAISLSLGHLHAINSAPVTTIITLDLRFEPTTEGEKPPQQFSLRAKLKSSTLLGNIPYKETTALCNLLQSNRDFTRYVSTSHLTSKRFSEVLWSQEITNTGTSDMEPPEYNSISENMHTSNGLTNTRLNDHSVPSYYTRVSAPVQIPLLDSRRPKKALMVPTFTSCIVARNYCLELDLTYKAPRADPSSVGQIIRTLAPSSTLGLSVPLHVGLEPTPVSQGSCLESEQSICQQHLIQHHESAIDELNAYFSPLHEESAMSFKSTVSNGDSASSRLHDYASVGFPPSYAPHL